LLLFRLQNIVLLLSYGRANEVEKEESETPEGYYAFIQSPSSFPPTVRPPPYQSLNVNCPDYQNTKPYVSPNNLCGDLNKGKIPINPMGNKIKTYSLTSCCELMEIISFLLQSTKLISRSKRDVGNLPIVSDFISIICFLHFTLLIFSKQ
jgi:hypothetical protein